MLRLLNKWISGGAKGQPPALAPLPSTFSSNGAYWEARDRREAAWRARRIESARDEAQDVDRRAWWGNHPGVASRLWRNFHEAFAYAAAGQWRDADVTVALRCLPYARVLDDPGFRRALQERSPAWVHVDIGNAWSAMAMARSWCREPGVDECLARALPALIESLERVKSARSSRWDSDAEYLAIDALSTAAIARDRAAMDRLCRLLAGIEFESNHAPLFLRLAGTSFAPAARAGFEEHFTCLRSRTSEATRWHRPAGFDPMQYLVLCAVLSERMEVDWDGPVDWHRVIDSILR